MCVSSAALVSDAETVQVLKERARGKWGVVANSVVRLSVVQARGTGGMGSSPRPGPLGLWAPRRRAQGELALKREVSASARASSRL